VEVTSGAPGLTFRDEDEAAAFARLLREAIRRGWGVHHLEPPWLLAAVSRDLSAAVRATTSPASAQASPGRGPVRAAPGDSAACSDQPDRLTVEVAARLAEVHPRTVRKWIARGAVLSVRGPRGAHLVDAGSLVAVISRRREGSDERKAA
jgi:hypothetical protein